jgi:hypothetical protein
VNYKCLNRPVYLQFLSYKQEKIGCYGYIENDNSKKYEIAADMVDMILFTDMCTALNSSENDLGKKTSTIFSNPTLDICVSQKELQKEKTYSQVWRYFSFVCDFIYIRV